MSKILHQKEMVIGVSNHHLLLPSNHHNSSIQILAVQEAVVNYWS